MDNLIQNKPLSQRFRNVIINDVIRKKRKLFLIKLKHISKETLKGKKWLLKLLMIQKDIDIQVTKISPQKNVTIRLEKFFF